MRQIEIDWEIHQMIEAERKGFDEPDYIALRRLLKLPEVQPDETPDVEAGIPWMEDGVVIPHGSEAQMIYLRGQQVYNGRFLNGLLVVQGGSYRTLSEAASSLATTKDGKKTSLNGWTYWTVRLPGKKSFQSLGVMRQQAKQVRK